MVVKTQSTLTWKAQFCEQQGNPDSMLCFPIALGFRKFVCISHLCWWHLIVNWELNLRKSKKNHHQRVLAWSTEQNPHEVRKQEKSLQLQKCPSSSWVQGWRLSFQTGVWIQCISNSALLPLCKKKPKPRTIPKHPPPAPNHLPQKTTSSTQPTSLPPSSSFFGHANRKPDFNLWATQNLIETGLFFFPSHSRNQWTGAHPLDNRA